MKPPVIKPFRTFLSGFTIDDNGYAVPHEPIHFNRKRSSVGGGFSVDADGYAVPHTPVAIKEGLDKDDLESRLHEHQRELHDEYGDFHKDLASHLKDYTINSADMNHHLIQRHLNRQAPTSFKGGRDALLKASTHTVGHKHSLYSGVKGWNVEEAAKRSKDGVIHLPAFTSASTDSITARRFTKESAGGVRHVMKINMKSEDRAVHVGNKTSWKTNERESILPAGTKLKYLKSTELQGGRVRVHHFDVHSQPTSVDDYYKNHCHPNKSTS